MAFERFFGRGDKIPTETTTTTTIPPPHDNNITQINLQKQIDTLNEQILQWENRKNKTIDQAVIYKNQNNKTMAIQKLNEKKLLQEQIDTATVNVQHLMKKMSSVIRSNMLINTHKLLKETNESIKSNNSSVDMNDFQDTLLDDSEIDNQANEMYAYMNENGPLQNGKELDDEFEQLGKDNTFDNLNDYPPIIRTETRTTINNTTGTTTTTTKITTSKPIPINSNNKMNKQRQNIFDDLYDK